jgi:imidazoleglycerol-phosphate dehydratase
MRTSTISRKTVETDITLSLNLDGTGKANIATSVGFLDHMLRHIAVHGLFDLDVKATGDLEIDPHHTVEDVGIVLGQAFDQALGDRQGIVRVGSAYVPMDAEWHMPSIGALPTTLIPHFLESFAFTAKNNLHARVEYGRDDHHQAEALFKALGRALDAATLIDPRRAGSVPSTKGTLTR